MNVTCRSDVLRFEGETVRGSGQGRITFAREVELDTSSSVVTEGHSEITLPLRRRLKGGGNGATLATIQRFGAVSAQFEIATGSVLARQTGNFHRLLAYVGERDRL